MRLNIDKAMTVVSQTPHKKAFIFSNNDEAENLDEGLSLVRKLFADPYLLFNAPVSVYLFSSS